MASSLNLQQTGEVTASRSEATSPRSNRYFERFVSFVFSVVLDLLYYLVYFGLILFSLVIKVICWVGWKIYEGYNAWSGEFRYNHPPTRQSMVIESPNNESIGESETVDLESAMEYVQRLFDSTNIDSDSAPGVENSLEDKNEEKEDDQTQSLEIVPKVEDNKVDDSIEEERKAIERQDLDSLEMIEPKLPGPFEVELQNSGAMEMLKDESSAELKIEEGLEDVVDGNILGAAEADDAKEGVAESTDGYESISSGSSGFSSDSPGKAEPVDSDAEPAGTVKPINLKESSMTSSPESLSAGRNRSKSSRKKLSREKICPSVLMPPPGFEKLPLNNTLVAGHAPTLRRLKRLEKDERPRKKTEFKPHSRARKKQNVYQELKELEESINDMESDSRPDSPEYELRPSGIRLPHGVQSLLPMPDSRVPYTESTSSPASSLEQIKHRTSDFGPPRFPMLVVALDMQLLSYLHHSPSSDKLMQLVGKEIEGSPDWSLLRNVVFDFE